MWSATPNRFLVEEVEDLPPGRALDLGAGEGRNAIWLAQLGWEVTAVDFSGVAIEKARSISQDRSVAVTWIVEDLLAYQADAGAFDLVILLYIHLREPEFRRILDLAIAALAPAGMLLVIGHDSDNINHGTGGPQDPSVLYNAQDLINSIGGRLNVIRARQVFRPVATEQGERRAIDVLVRAVAPS